MRHTAAVLGTLAATAALSLATTAPAIADAPERATHSHPADGTLVLFLDANGPVEYEDPVGCITLPEGPTALFNDTNRRVYVSTTSCAFHPRVVDSVRPGEFGSLPGNTRSLVVRS
ncbi:hypothetical protein KIK06_17205 [Nocardiopsis sp. EMB25]|uniref:hypothetical protein n=1 Tax=Nocardiopsis TaxID=2013 RepID=UPI00034DCD68|nr:MULTISPECIES: hypothetical protein [Nocardiopsis]MCY9785625.1 hypothetical protein [Nocardiopsis sp. EMB25]